MDPLSGIFGVDGVEDEYTRGMLDDLQLAAELGKTLLERNKELETDLKQHQNVIDDQTQEIEYLTKQTVALREVNDSRLRIYEQLEVSIQDLERANHRLAIDNSNDKKQIKSLTSTIESLESKCEELQNNLDELKTELETNKKKNHRSDPVNAERVVDKYIKLNSSEYDEVDRPVNVSSSNKKTCEDEPRVRGRSQETQTVYEEDKSPGDSNMKTQLNDLMARCTRDERRISELEDQLQSLVMQNQELEAQIINFQHKECDSKSMHDELSTLEEVRQGQLCSKCLRTIDAADDMSLSICDDREDDSMLDAPMSEPLYRNSIYIEVPGYGKTSSTQKNNSAERYKDLIEKYEALKKVQKQYNRSTKSSSNTTNNSLSLQEELAMSGDFSTLSTKDTDEESGHGDSLRPDQKKSTKSFSHTPTDFSEAETSSSGFSDETSNKSTQTDQRPGSFLCTIGDGEDCISIYDDASNIGGRFRHRPEYRELFGEIFSVLKKAAKNKEDNEQAPELDDQVKTFPKVPPVTPCTESLPDFPDNCTDDTQSVLSSTMSEISASQIEPVTVIENIRLNFQPKDPQERILTPLVRQPLESLAMGANTRKRSSSRKKKQFQDRSDSPITHIVGSPTIKYVSRPSSGRRRRGERNNENDNWNGHTLQFWSSSRSLASPTPSQSSDRGSLKQERIGLEYKPSIASQELHRLKKLEKSYADVLRAQSPQKRETNRRRRK